MEFKFDLKNTAIYEAVKLEKTPIFKWAPLYKKIFFFLMIFFSIFFLIGFFIGQINQSILGISLLFFVLFSFFGILDLFFNSKLKNPKLLIKIEEAAKIPEKFNLAEFLSYEVAKATDSAINFGESKKFSKIPSALLFYFLLDFPKLNFIFSRVLLDLKEIKKTLEGEFTIFKAKEEEISSPKIEYSEDFQNTILEAFKIACSKGHLRIEIGDLLLALAKNNLSFKEILIHSNLKIEDIENLVWWLESLQERINKAKRWWEYDNLIRKGTLAKEWVAGYTLTLDRYSIDLTEEIKKKGFPEIFGHQKDFKALERVLALPKYNNALLIGEPGIGKKTIILGLAAKSFFGQTLPEINYKRVVALDLPLLLSQIPNKEEVEATLDQIFQEAVSAGNVILIIDHLHNFVGLAAGIERVGVIDISGILASYLILPRFQIIATTTYAGLHKNLEQNPALLELFRKIEVSEISEKETMQILEDSALSLEKKYKVFVSYPALRDIISFGARYFPNVPFPKKALHLLDEVMVYVATETKDKVVKSSHVAKVFSEKTQIPVGELEEKEKEILLNLENLIHKRIIDQEEAVKEVSTALRRARAEVTVRKGPMGSFLFLGPTGVGKTETSKALTEIYFGSENRMIRLDMSEFQAVQDIPRLIGSPGEEGLLTTQVRENPFSLILLDEIEKAHFKILNLFLQVFDEGHLTDGVGRRVDFKNTIIIATSNAGYKIILKALEEKTEWMKVKEILLDYLFEKAIFRPEFINRFDAVVVFKPLSKENLLDISELMLQKMKKSLKEKGIEFVITEPLKEKIVQLGYDPRFGAREMKRVIQEKVENVLARALLTSELKRGHKVEVDPREFKLKIEKIL